MIETDIIIIGAGPVGLFAVFEAGLLKLKCHLIDSLPQPGGQCSEIYPKKPIYDIPGFPSVLAGELIDNLMQQAAPFKPGFTLGEAAQDIEKLENIIHPDEDFMKAIEESLKDTVPQLDKNKLNGFQSNCKKCRKETAVKYFNKEKGFDSDQHFTF